MAETQAIHIYQMRPPERTAPLIYPTCSENAIALKWLQILCKKLVARERRYDGMRPPGFLVRLLLQICVELKCRTCVRQKFVARERRGWDAATGVSRAVAPSDLCRRCEEGNSMNDML